MRIPYWQVVSGYWHGWNFRLVGETLWVHTYEVNRRSLILQPILYRHLTLIHPKGWTEHEIDQWVVALKPRIYAAWSGPG